MLRAKIKDLLDELPTNEDYYCYQVPEEYHVWTLRHKWQDMEERYGVRPLYIKVHGVRSDSKNEIIKYSEANPLIVHGVPIKGQESSNQNVTYNWAFRIDSVSEINEVLSELATNNAVELLSVKELDVYSPKSGITLKAEVSNPDHSGSSLYIVAFVIGTQTKLYPKVNVGTMAEYVGKFQGNIAQCCVTDGRINACVIKTGLKRRNIIRRKKQS